MEKKSATTNQRSASRARQSVSCGTAWFSPSVLIVRECAQADDAGAVSLNQSIQGGNRIVLAAVEERFRSRCQIRQAQAYQAVPRSRL